MWSAADSGRATSAYDAASADTDTCTTRRPHIATSTRFTTPMFGSSCDGPSASISERPVTTGAILPLRELPIGLHLHQLVGRPAVRIDRVAVLVVQRRRRHLPEVGKEVVAIHLNVVARVDQRLKELVYRAVVHAVVPSVAVFVMPGIDTSPGDGRSPKPRTPAETGGRRRGYDVPRQEQRTTKSVESSQDDDAAEDGDDVVGYRVVAAVSKL